MRYISNSRSPGVSRNNGYWIKGEKIYNVTTGIHAKFILANPLLFDLTEEAARVINEKHTKTGTAAHAREELLRNVASNGWIGVRHHSHRDYWSIQCDVSDKRKDVINEFIVWALANKVMKMNDPTAILGLDDPTDRHLFDWKSERIILKVGSQKRPCRRHFTMLGR